MRRALELNPGSGDVHYARTLVHAQRGEMASALEAIARAISRSTVEAALALEGVDNLGLTRLDHSYLKTIIEYYGGGPVGIEAISATLQEETDTLVDVVEPYLLKIGMVIRTSSGRKVSEAAYRHLGMPIQQKLF